MKQDFSNKHIPGLSSRDQIDMAPGMTLAALQQFAAKTITDEALVAVDADLQKLPAKE